MKEYGIVKYFDNHMGLIRGVDGQDYILKKTDIENNIDVLKENDYVVFFAEKYNTIETSLNIARSIKKIEKADFPKIEYKTKRH